MDINNMMSTLLAKETLSALSEKTGASQKDISSVLSSSLPMLLNGAKEQEELADSGFAQALSDHAKKDTTDLNAFMKGVDLADGGKIIAHLLGANTVSNSQNISGSTGVSATQVAGILSAIAPLLMSLLGQQSQQASAPSVGSGLVGALLGNSNIGSLAASLLGAPAPAQETTSTGKKKKKKPAASAKKDENPLGTIASALTNLLK